MEIFRPLAVLKWAGHGRSITSTDLVAYRTELVVISWDVLCSRRHVKHGELPTSYMYLRVATALKASSHEFLRHLTSLLRHSPEYPRVPSTYIVEMPCRTRRALHV